MKKAAHSGAAFELFIPIPELWLLHANLGFVDRLIQMLDRLHAVAVEIMLGRFQFMFSVVHRFQCLVDMRMRFGRGRGRWNWCCRCGWLCRRLRSSRCCT